MSNELRSYIADLFSGFAGQDAVLIIPRPYLTLCENDHRAALLLSQCVYWSDRTKDTEGWFAKSYVEWLDELGLSEYEVRRASKVLADVGLETKLRKFNGAPTVHYRIDKVKFSECILKKLQNRNLSNLGIDPEETSESLTESTTETTPEKKDLAPIGAPPSSIEGDSVETTTLYPCTSEDIVALIRAWWDWIPLHPTKRGVVIASKQHYANKTIRAFAQNLTERGVMPADMIGFLGDVRFNDESRWAYLRGKELPFNYVGEILPEWVELDRAENWYTPAEPRITPRKPGVKLNLNEIVSSTNPLEDFANHPDFIVDLPRAYISPHDAQVEDVGDGDSSGDAALLDELAAEGITL